MYIDVGPNQELAYVKAVNFLGAGVGGTISLTLSGKIAHDRGCVIQFDAQTPAVLATPPSPLGNPGPQPQFNFKDPTYLPVVPVVYRYN